MAVELKKYQVEAYEGVNNSFEQDNLALLVQPTGTGKTFVAMRMFEDYEQKNILFVAPSKEIINRFKKNIEMNYGRPYNEVFPGLHITTYQYLSKQSKESIQNSQFDLVVFDEAHHMLADKWSEKTNLLISSHSDTKFLGMTATPKRSDGKDVTSELFRNNVAYNMSLEQAVAEDILSFPQYITSVYSYSEIISDFESRIQSVRNEEQREMLKKDIDSAKRMLENSVGMSEIFERFIEKKDGKYIVFCKNIAHMEQMMQTSKEWFGKVNEKVSMYSISSQNKDTKNKREIRRFEGDFTKQERELEANDEGALKLLFTVDMINEGVHIEDIAGTIMIRPTASHILYMQQLGRAMAIGHQGKPVVFDLVNNIDSQKAAMDFLTRVKTLKQERGEDIKKFDEQFQIHYEQRGLLDVLTKINSELEVDWDMQFQDAKQWLETHNYVMPKQIVEDSEAGMIERKTYYWIKYNRTRYMQEYNNVPIEEIPLEVKHKIEKLKSIGIELVQTNRRKNSLETFVAFYQENNRLPKATKSNSGELSLYNWMLNHSDNPEVIRIQNKCGYKKRKKNVPVTKQTFIEFCEANGRLPRSGIIEEVPLYLWMNKNIIYEDIAQVVNQYKKESAKKQTREERLKQLEMFFKSEKRRPQRKNGEESLATWVQTNISSPDVINLFNKYGIKIKKNNTKGIKSTKGYVRFKEFCEREERLPKAYGQELNIYDWMSANKDRTEVIEIITQYAGEKNKNSRKTYEQNKQDFIAFCQKHQRLPENAADELDMYKWMKKHIRDSEVFILFNTYNGEKNKKERTYITVEDFKRFVAETGRLPRREIIGENSLYQYWRRHSSDKEVIAAVDGIREKIVGRMEKKKKGLEIYNMAQQLEKETLEALAKGKKNEENDSYDRR